MCLVRLYHVCTGRSTLIISRCSKRVRTATVLRPIMFATGFKPEHARYSVASAFGSTQFQSNVCALIDMLILSGTNFAIVWCFTVLFAVDLWVRRWFVWKGGEPLSSVPGTASATSLAVAVAVAGSAGAIASPTVNVLAGLEPAVPGMVSAVLVGLCAPAATSFAATAARRHQPGTSGYHGHRGCCRCHSLGDYKVAWRWAFAAAYVAAFLYSGATLGAASASQASLLLPAVTLFAPFFLGYCVAIGNWACPPADKKRASCGSSCAKVWVGVCTLLLCAVVLPVILRLPRSS